MMKKIYLILSFLAFAVSAHGAPRHPSRIRIDLGGEWQSTLGTCRLPGTTDENRLGPGCSDSTATHQLTRLYPYAGVVDYTREIEIPHSFAGKRLQLTMERTKPSTLWVDGDSIGSRSHLYAPHVYLFGPLAPGRHLLRIRIDNSPASVPAEIHGSHAWSDATQTNWNGILGDFHLEALPRDYIRTVAVYPDIARRQATVVAHIAAESAVSATLSTDGFAWNSPEKRKIPRQSIRLQLTAGDNRMEFSVDMGDNPLLWSEFHPALYKLLLMLRTRNGSDRATVDFGMREFGVEGTQFVVNGFKTFLRGKHDACVFPLMGYAPMDTEAWRKVFRTAKRYGINHYRCHSYAPPRAAFEAADIEGIYLQPELPLWGAIDPANDSLNRFLRREGAMLLDYAGNHPSFTMMGLGNELGGDVDEMRSWLEEFRRRDPRHLYSFGANNFLGWKGPLEGEDFLTTCRVGGGEGYSTHVRTSFAHVDADQGGLLNGARPSSTRTYAGAIARSPRPVVGHETGQFQIFPDFTEIERYTGVLYPFNLEIFRQRLAENGMAEQAADFHRASGRFAALCYKADIEQALRTPGMGGFQLLDLQDYPGQGTALVGMLDAFMQSKGIITEQAFRGFCAPVVPLALIDDYCRWNDEPLHIGVAVANYAESAWNTPVAWRLATDDNTWVRTGSLPSATAQGAVARIGEIVLPLTELLRPVRLKLTLTTGEQENSYNLWVYPRRSEPADGIVLATRIDSTLKRQLDAGSRVLLTPRHEDVTGQSVGGLFTPDYWNYSMFRTISERAGKEISPGTLTVLCDPTHPLLREFPTDGHSDWQWWSIARNARPMILDALGPRCRPVVQVVDNLERCHRLGLVFEFAVGKGKLLVSMCDPKAVAGTPEGNQWNNALVHYARSADFDPALRLDWEELNRLFGSIVGERNIEGVENASDYTQGR